MTLSAAMLTAFRTKASIHASASNNALTVFIHKHGLVALLSRTPHQHMASTWNFPVRWETLFFLKAHLERISQGPKEG